MRFTSPLAVPAIFGIALLAGCLGGPDAPLDGDGLDTPPLTLRAALEGIPAPDFSPASAVDTWESFLTNYPKRDWPLIHNKGAADYLAAELEKAGFRTQTMLFETPLSGDVESPIPIRVIRGILDGADPTHRFALIAHYDTVTATAQGAYDDGAGTIAELEICKLLAQQKARLQHSIECLFFDAEERGLLASRAYVDWYLNTPDRGFVYDLGFGYDMTGINWPGHEWRLYAMIGTQHPELEDLSDPFNVSLEIALHDFLGAKVLPGAADGIHIIAEHDRNSDEQSFKKMAGIPVIRFAGGRNASHYPMYHRPLDTVPYVYQFVGGRENFEKGFDAVIRSSYYTILGFDGFDPRALPVE